VRCGIPKSRLSRRIAKLEERLGVGLIRRDSRRFEVTDVGRQLYQQACSIRDSALSAVGMAQDSVSEPSGLLRVACPVALATAVVMPVVAEFAKTYPRVRVALQGTLGAADTLAERFDVIIHPSIGVLPDSEMVARRLGVATYVLVAAPAVAQALQAMDDPQQLAEVPTIGWDFLGPRGHWHLVGPQGGDADVKVNERFRSDNLLIVREAAAQGLGVAPMARRLCASDLEQGRLQVVLPGWSPPPVTWYAVYASRRSLPTAGQHFIAQLVAAFDRAGV
jgi:DNA-binding transcriptional LysR family regulator